MKADVLDSGRAAFARHAWLDAFTTLSAADGHSPLDAPDLERLAMAAYLLGRDSESAEAMIRAHHAFLAGGDAIRAARCAFWLGFGRTDAERARASGWLAKARRLLDDCGRDCVERGYVLLPAALDAVARGDIATAGTIFAEAARIGGRFGDVDLVSRARAGRGRTLNTLDEKASGVALLDEVMVGVMAGEVSPLIAGTVYCSAIEACFEMGDMGRAQEWTGALSDWCAAEPDVVAYRGHCLVRRAEVMLLHGVWVDAMSEAEQACERLSRPGQPPAGPAFYLLAELHRLRGEFAKAEHAYTRASEAGRTPQPGLALLRLAQGRTDAAKAALCHLADDGRDRRKRATVLAACVEIQIAAGDLAAARTAADDLAALATALDTPFVHALSAHASGATLLAEGYAGAALAALDRARTLWRGLDAPYDVARADALAGLAYRALGDADTSELQLDAARRVFRELGALPDLARLDQLAASVRSRHAGGLTAREVQVLRLVAEGRTNRAIADVLGISEKTVARHMSNIFTKLDLSSRAAATAYAFQHGMVQP